MPRAQDTRQRPKSPRRRLCRVPSSEKNLTAKRLFARAICRALGKVFSECQRRHSAKKISRQRRCSVDVAFAEYRQLGHSAKTFFFQKLFAECRGGKALGKDFLLFKKKSLPSAMSWHSAKFPSFAECHDHCTRQINRNCNFFCFLHSTDTNSSNIYHMSHIYHKHHNNHIYITTKPFSHIISQPQLK